MSQTYPLSTKERLEQFEHPVVHSPGSPAVWHIPVVHNGSISYYCANKSDIRVSPLEAYRRKRGARMCNRCKSELGAGYPDDAPYGEL